MIEQSLVGSQVECSSLQESTTRFAMSVYPICSGRAHANQSRSDSHRGLRKIARRPHVGAHAILIIHITIIYIIL